MRRLGFKQVGGSFVSRRGPVQHRFQLKSLRARGEPQLLLNLVVAIENPFDPERANAANWFANAFLEPEGISHRIRMHWTAEGAAGAQPCFEQWAPSFFIRFTDIGSLIDLVRAANEQKKTVDAFLAGPPSAVPADDEAASEFVTHLSRLTASERPEPPLINYELLSLLHWHAGRTAEAIEWAWGVYDKSSQLDVDERARMLRWIAAMQRPPLQQETTQDLV